MCVLKILLKLRFIKKKQKNKHFPGYTVIKHHRCIKYIERQGKNSQGLHSWTLCAAGCQFLP